MCKCLVCKGGSVKVDTHTGIETQSIPAPGGSSVPLRGKVLYAVGCVGAYTAEPVFVLHHRCSILSAVIERVSSAVLICPWYGVCKW